MNALCTIKNLQPSDDGGSTTTIMSSKILSGGDEKVLRLFEAPYNFVKTMNSLNPHFKTEGAPTLIFSKEHSNNEVESMMLDESAKKQPLGLMNKPAVLLANKGARVDEEEEGGFGAEFDPITVLSNTKKVQEVIQVAEPPVEDVLMARTLWPEQQKLYGHVFEVFAVAASHRGDLAASACKAQEIKYADIIIWDLTKGQTTVPACRLRAHKLTIVQLEFTHDDQYLLSCSRDRQWCLFKRQEGTLNFELMKKFKDAHSRIIWGISWSHDDRFFATGSREKQKGVKVWHGPAANEQVGTLASELPQNAVASTTALSFFPCSTRAHGGEYSLLVGLESGALMIWTLTDDGGDMPTWRKMTEVASYYGHTLSVKRILFNLRATQESDKTYQVATCGSDQTVRIFRIKF